MTNQIVKTTITGRLTADVTVEVTPNGKSVATIGIAVNYSYTDKKTRQKVEKVKFYNPQVWGKVAESLAQNAQQGDLVKLNCTAKPNSYLSEKRQEVINETILSVRRFKVVSKAKRNQ